MNKKRVAILVVSLLLVSGGVWWQFFRLSPEDCASLEKYDAFTGSCYYDCTSDDDCAAKAEKIEKELNDYFEGSEAKIVSQKTKNNQEENEAKQSQQAQPAETDGTAQKEYTAESTGSETGGKVYTVTSAQELSPQPSQRDAELWQLFVRVASKQTISERLVSFEVFDDGNNDSAASVWQSQDNPEKWHMNVNAAFMEDKKDLIHTMVHEFGHIVTLNTTQVEQTSGACPRFEIPEGCTKQGSYLASFEQRFWDKYGDETPANYGENQDEVMDFYQGKAVSFVTEYAATNPVEDLAETWAHFVLRAKPTDASEKSDKIRSLYDYPELVQTRDRIRANLGDELTRRNLLKR